VTVDDRRGGGAALAVLAVPELADVRFLGGIRSSVVGREQDRYGGPWSGVT
jgi:hypothetical protein